MQKFTIDGTEFYSKFSIIRLCWQVNAWYEHVEDPNSFIEKVKRIPKRQHIFTFFQRVPDTTPRYHYYCEPYRVAVIALKNYEHWWKNQIGKKTRQAIKKSQKNNVCVYPSKFDDNLIKGISSIWNETPVRQGKKFPHYNKSLEAIKREVGTFIDRSVFIGAYYEDKLIGYAKIVFEDEFVDILNIISMLIHRGKCVQNALVSKIVEVCSNRNIKYIAYGDYYSGGLGDFKRKNGFTEMVLPRYYVPLNGIGQIGLKLRLHRPVSGLLPEQLSTKLKHIRNRVYTISLKSK